MSWWHRYAIVLSQKIMTNTPTISQSMTGYCLVHQDFPEGGFVSKSPPLRVELECQSINSKYLEVFWRADDSLRRFEMPIRQAIKQAFGRGRISINLSIRLLAGNIHSPMMGCKNDPDQIIAQASLSQIETWQSAILKRFPTAQKLSVFECLQLMQWNAPISVSEKSRAGLGFSAMESILSGDDESQKVGLESSLQSVMTVVEEALKALRQSREQEAGRILPIMREKAESLMTHGMNIKLKTSQVVQSMAERLKAQVAPLLAEIVDPSRLAQEVALLAIRHDVSEELDRLNSHGVQLQDLLSGAHGSLGKPLEFLLQELGREVNTIASKTTQTEVSTLTMEMKHLIDQIREQAQNLQ